ncbi:A/G-specific adenine glycosylase [Janibacter sp. GXQ6167]|uniref:A/G-specific adenine glycosylase n=1 Tax=Janibacter sp. GXQ6167 TaxID=3240791 RepID=UPI0035266F6B
MDSLAFVHDRVLTWAKGALRPLPWRDPDCSPWGVYVSEVMSQQTPVARVEPAWREWMARWPTPAALAADTPGEAVRMWKRLGYPRRALRLWESAGQMVAAHDGEVPRSHADLLALPGVGEYTAAAVASFAYGEPVPVVDTNVRRVLVRVFDGREHAAPAMTAAERELAARAMPADRDEANAWNVAAMEFGALICTARSPACDSCPIRSRCAWQLAGRPAYDGPPRRGQAWHGTDRQARGALLAVLRAAPGAVPRDALDAAWDDAAQRDRALRTLIEDRLVEPLPGERFALPS